MALGSTYENLNRKLEAIKCFERAASCIGNTVSACAKLGRLFAELGDKESAEFYYQQCITSLQEKVSSINIFILTFLFLKSHLDIYHFLFCSGFLKDEGYVSCDL